jgi:hypothetical protein
MYKLDPKFAFIVSFLRGLLKIFKMYGAGYIFLFSYDDRARGKYFRAPAPVVIQGYYLIL